MASGKATENYFRFSINSHVELQALTKVISIADVDGNTVYAFGTDNQLLQLESLGYKSEILPNPGDAFVPRMSSAIDDIRAWDVYPTYDGYVDMMNQFAIDYPNLCVVENIGTTINGRALLFAKVSDNVNLQENEPEVMYTSTMHGNETVGYILTLQLIDYLLSNYGIDSLATRLVDSCEIWINPNANPDGTYYVSNSSVAGAHRSNANGVDLNRNFPDPQDGDHPDGNSWQPETIAMMNFAETHSFIISANMHSGVEVVNYPWDTWATLHADDQWYMDISRHYADSAQFYNAYFGYMDYLNNGITNGYDWYEVDGGRQDYMNYWHRCREVTLELSNAYILEEKYLNAHWIYNKSSLLNYLEHALYGVRGIVTDAVTSAPIDAVVRVIDHDFDNSEVFTDPDVGDYHRMIEAGTYSFEYSASNYYTDTIPNITVTDYNTVIADMELMPISEGISLVFENHDVLNAQPNNTVNMFVSLRNFGNTAALNSEGILSCPDEYITVTQAEASFPTINALQGAGTSLTAYQFSIDADCPGNYAVVFQLDLTADGGYSQTQYFNLTIDPVIESFESGGFAYMPWSYSGDSPWIIVPTVGYDGSFYVQSGVIGNNQSSVLTIEATIVNDDIISFYYKVSSEAGADYLNFYIDGEKLDSFSGEIGWTAATYNVTAGNHNFEWRYMKSGSGTVGSDAASLDFIVFPKLAGNITIATEYLPNWEVGNPYSYQLEASNGIGSAIWNDKYNGLAGTGLTLSTGGLVSGTPVAEGTISFTAEVTDEIGGTDEKPFSFEIGAAFTCGDVNRDGNIDILDIVYLINFKYKAGPQPEPMESGDVNNDLVINILDVVYLINFKYKSGPAPNCP